MRRGVTARHSFAERIIGVLSLREEMIREVVEDATANRQALRALAIGSLGPAVGAMFVLGLPALPFFFVLGTVVWCLYGFVVYLLATKLFAAADTEANFSAFARGIGFAGLPRIIQFATFNDILVIVFGVIGVAWTVAATVIAARLALKLNSQRAAASALVGAAVLFVVTGLLG